MPANFFISDPIVLTDAQIKASPTTFPILVPAPGANKIIVLRGGIAVSNFSIANKYTNRSSNFPTSILRIAYNDDFHSASTDQDPFLFFDGADFTPNGKISMIEPRVEPFGTTNITSPLSVMENVVNAPLKLVVYNTAGNFTGGNAINTLTLTLYYVIVDV